ncbi:MAG: integrase core domain-containing protein [Acidobacteriota bacterium]
MTVGKSFVAKMVRAGQAEIEKKRRELKHQIPRWLPKNVIWGLDLTTLDDQPVLGVIDRGTRACLELTRLPDKATLTILKSIIALIERFGRPKCIRTDNEGVFASSLFRLVLRMLGVHHQKTQPKAPWQNGRIERFFGTLKSAIRLREDPKVEPKDLAEFRPW